MRKMALFIGVMMLVIGFALVSTTLAQAVKWRMATGRTPALTPFHEGDVKFAEMVNKDGEQDEWRETDHFGSSCWRADACF